jgi:hypothetical protein
VFSHSSYFPSGYYPPTYFPGGSTVVVDEPGVGRRPRQEDLPRNLDVAIWVWLDPAHSHAVCAITRPQVITLALSSARSQGAVAIDHAYEHIHATVVGQLSLDATIAVEIQAMTKGKAPRDRAREEAIENAFLLGVTRRDA